MSIATKDIRRRAIEAYKKGNSTQARIAQSYSVNIRTFQRWLARFAATGESAPQPRGHRLALFRGDRLAALDRLVQDRPDATLEELRSASKANGSIMAVKRALDRLGYRYKKKHSTPANKTAKTSGCGGSNGLRNCPVWPRRAWCSSTNRAPRPNMTRQRGRAMEGNRLFAKAPHGHWGTTTLISSVRLNGATSAMEIAGATDSEVFREYVRRILAPTLMPGDLVVMDYLRTHYDAAAIAMIEARGATAKFLPPYSPDYNPIEKMWSKIKALLRGWAARTQQELSAAIARAFEAVTPEDVRG